MLKSTRMCMQNWKGFALILITVTAMTLEKGQENPIKMRRKYSSVDPTNRFTQDQKLKRSQLLIVNWQFYGIQGSKLYSFFHPHVYRQMYVDTKNTHLQRILTLSAPLKPRVKDTLVHLNHSFTLTQGENGRVSPEPC